MKLFLEGGDNKSLFIFYFLNLSNLGGELVCMFFI